MNLQEKGPAAVKEGITATVLVIILQVMSTVIPLAGLFIYLAGIPFFLVTRKYGFHFVLAFVCMAYIFAGVLSGFVNAIFDVLSALLPAVMMGELSRLGRRQKEILAKGVIAGILCQLAAAAAQYVMWGSPMAQSVREILRQPVQKALDQGEITRHGAELLAQSYEMMLKAMPSIIFLWTVIVVLLIYYIGCGILIRRGMAIENYEPFILFSFSRQLVFGSFVLYACAWVSDLLGIGDGQVLYLNLLIILWFLFALQGTAVTAFLCRRMRFPAVLSALFLGILLISMIGTIILFIVGLLDIFARFRDRSSRDKE